MKRRLAILAGGLLFLAATDPPPFVLKPEAAQAVQHAFEAMRPTVVYQSIQLDRDHVDAKLCEGDQRCFMLRMTAPGGHCAGTVAGPFCLVYGDGTPSEAAKRIVEAALSAEKSALWSETPRTTPPEAPPQLAAPAPDAGLSGPAWRAKDPVTREHGMVAVLCVIALLISRRSSWRDAGLTLAVSLAAGVWLDQVNPDAWAGDDESAGMLLAQDCLKLSVCHLTSIDSGVPGFTNGAVWLHLLTFVGMLGGTTVGVRLLVIALMAAGVGASFLTVRRWVHPTMALPVAVFAVYGLSTGNDLSASNLVDACAVFFPAAIAACSLAIFVQTRRTAALLLAAVLLSHAVNTHVAAASLLPALLLSAALAGRRPVLAAIAATVAYVVTTLITSRFALTQSWTHLNPSLKTLIPVAWALVVAAGAFVQPRFIALSRRVRLALLGSWLLLPHVLGMIWLELQHRPPTGRYLPPVIAPASVVAAAVLVGAVGRLVRVQWIGQAIALLVGGVLLAMAPVPHRAAHWTFEDGRIAAEHLEKKGWCHGQQFGRVQGPQCTSFAFATIPYACRSTEPGDFRRQLRAWVADRRQLPSEMAGVEAIPARGNHVILLSDVKGWLDKQHTELCFATDTERKCEQLGPQDGDPFLYSHRLALGFGNARHEAPYVMSFSFPVLPTTGETHQFSFTEDARSYGAEPGHLLSDRFPKCGWQITQVTGLEADRPLPANPVRLTSRDGGPARLVIERVVGGDCGTGFPGRQIPCLLETTDADPSWMQPRPSTP